MLEPSLYRWRHTVLDISYQVKTLEFVADLLIYHFPYIWFTRRLFYVIQYGCLPVLNLRLRPAQTSIERLREQFCSNNFYEVSEMVAKTNARIPPRLHDLFMEQGQQQQQQQQTIKIVPREHCAETTAATWRI